MVKNLIDTPLKSMVSLAPLLRFWEKNLVHICHVVAFGYKEILPKIQERSEA